MFIIFTAITVLWVFRYVETHYLTHIFKYVWFSRSWKQSVKN